MKKHPKPGRSAWGAAYIKALEAFVPPDKRLFEDKIVGALLPPFVRLLLEASVIRATLRAAFEKSAPGIQGALLCRTRRIDDIVRNAMRRGLDAVVILGAGLDTRACRLTELANTRILEIDLPHVQAWKRNHLSRLGVLPPNVRFIPCDLNVQTLEDALRIGGLPSSDRALFIWEGVSQYLRPQSVDAILSCISSRPSGTETVFTYVLEEVVAGRLAPGRSQAFRKSAARRPEPWHFGLDPSRVESFLAARGLNLRRDFGAQDQVSEYLRPLRRELEVSEIERIAIATVGPLGS